MANPEDNNPPQSKPDAPRQAMLSHLLTGMMVGSPHARALGFEAVSVETGRATLKFAWREDIVGDPATGVIAGGALMALLDHVCGAAALSRLERISAVVTLDLRIDYMRGAVPRRDIIAEAHCYKLARSVAFVRAVAHDGDREDPVANATAAFMLVDRPAGPGATA